MPDSAPLDSGTGVAEDSWSSAVGARIAAADRDFVGRDGGFVALNRAWSFSVRLDQDGAALSNDLDELSMRFVGWGRPDAIEAPLPAAPTAGECLAELDPAGQCLRRIEYVRGPVVESWINGSDGVEQAWELSERPAGEGPVVLQVAIEGASALLDGERVLLSGDGGGLWSTDGLAVWDANGDPLDAWFEVEDDLISVMVDDSDAVYPITVDPVTSTASVTWSGGAIAALQGTAVGGGGDVNGDGYDDVLIGAPGYSATDGVVYVYYGSATGPSTTADATLSSPATGAAFGSALDIAGDVNADGYDDVIVGGYRTTTTASEDGAAWIYHGSASGLSTTAAITLTGSLTASAHFGAAVASVGDVNGDGYADVIVGEYGYSSETGRAWVYGGSSAGISSATVRTLTGSTTGMRFGWSVSGGGNITSDAYSDFVVGAPYYTTTTYAGRALVYSGSATIFTTAPSATTYSGTAGYRYGTAVSLESSYNGDAYADLVVGAPSGTSTGVGRVYWYKSTGSALPAGNSGTWDGPGVASYFGAAISAVGDVNGDGYNDLMVGAPYYTTDYGYAALYQGSTSSPGAGVSTKFTGSSGYYLGTAVGGAGDVNGDGYNDVLIGAPGVGLYAGRATLHMGGADADGDGYLVNGTGVDQDCDDTDATVNPVAEEICDSDGVDENCDGVANGADASGAVPWYADADGDGFGDSGVTTDACDAPSGYVGVDGDCDDGDGAINPDATEVCDAAVTDENCDGTADGADATGTSTWYADTDGDGYGDPASDTEACTAPSGYVADSTDCDDGAASINPGAAEVCDAANTDEDCDGSADDASATGKTTWYEDIDADGYGDSGSSVAQCDAPTGYVATSGDCDDGDDGVSPGAAEVCDPSDTDENCDGLADDSSASGTTTWYADGDGDGHGDPSDSTASCDVPAGYVSVNDDCDDGDAGISPAATEVCDPANVDENCDGSADDATATGKSNWFIDSDSDGYGSGISSVSACDKPTGYVGSPGDCNDSAAAINPGATEVCDASNTDEDCNGLADDPSATGKTTWYADSDRDGYGDAAGTLDACDAPTGYVSDSQDCDDRSADVSPVGTEVVGNGRDENCDGLETCYVDADDDGYRPDASSTVASTDTDCTDAGEARDGEPADDCDDGDAAYNPGASEAVCSDPNDYNCDGSVGYADDDEDGYAACEECDDNDADIFPGATEGVGDAVDSDCDGTELCYYDGDSDGYVDGGGATVSSSDIDCSGAQEAGDAAEAGDCDDVDAAINPGAPEVCDGLDNNCDGGVDDDEASDQTDWFLDADGDGYGDLSVGVTACDAPTGYVANSVDCDDDDASAYPGATEIIGDGADQDCDGVEVCYTDVDGDGYRPDTGVTVASATGDCLTEGEALADAPDGDCDDEDDAFNPGASEEDCTDPNDYNCDGSVGYDDADLDGYAACEECDDGDADINPDALELPGDAVDSDCDGTELCYLDGDDDGYLDGAGTTVGSDDVDCVDIYEGTDTDPTDDCDDGDADAYPGAAEVLDDGVDQDCDGADSTSGGDDTGTDDTGTDDTGTDDTGQDDTGGVVDTGPGDTAGTDKDGKCGCATPTSTPNAIGVIFGLLGLIGLRRRRS